MPKIALCFDRCSQLLGWLLPLKTLFVVSGLGQLVSRGLMKLVNVRSTLLLFFVVLGCCSGNCLQGQIQLDRFFPPAVGVGQSLELKVEGKFPEWPIKLVTDCGNVSVQAAEKSGQVLVEAMTLALF